MASGKQKNKKTFLQDFGYGPARLAAVTARIDWSRPDAMARARDALGLFVATLGELVRDAAREKRRQPGTFLNALAPDVDSAELPLLWLAVHHLEREGALTGLTPIVRAQLDTAGSTVSSHWRLLRDGTLPAPRLPDIADIDSDTLLALHAAQVCASADAGKAAGTLRLLKFAGQLHESRDESRAALLRQLRAIRKALGGTPAAIDYAAFRSLPGTLRRALLFTPGMEAAFLDAAAQAAARPPSPDFDPSFLERALDNLAAGTLDHLDVDTLFIGAAANVPFRTRIVNALANGSGQLACDDDVRERLIAGADLAELCLVACAAARSHDDMRRALQRLPALPHGQVLGNALHGFARIAWRDGLPADVPAHIAGDPAFRDDMLEEAAQRLAAHVRSVGSGGDDVHKAPALLFRHFIEWLNLAGPRAAREPLAALESALSAAGGALAAEIHASDLHALSCSGPRGEKLARTLATALREHDALRWETDYFAHLTDVDPALAMAAAGDDPRPHEIEALLHTPLGDTWLARYARDTARRATPAWHGFLDRCARYAQPPAALLAAIDKHPVLRADWQAAIARHQEPAK